MSEPTGTTPPAADPATPPVTPPPSTPPAVTDGTDYKALAAAAAAETEKWKGLARKHEDRAKANAEAAAGAKTVEQQLEEMRKVIADRDVADVSRSGRMAMTTVQAQLAGQGFSPDDVAGLLEQIDPVRLLKDGEPDDGAIKKLVESLIKVGGRTTPDRDQGQRGGNGPLDMNALIRRRAGVGK